MSEPIVFPQLSGLNWPSYLLEAWRTLYALGVPEENIRFVPELGHFAVPEISGQEPPGPVYDILGERLIVRRVDPQEVRPRLTVSVRADTVDTVRRNPDTGREEYQARTVGRLAHFLPPLLAGLPGAAPAEPAQPFLEAVTRQMSRAYPELVAALPEEARSALEVGVGTALAVITATDAEEQAALIRRHARENPNPEKNAGCYAAWLSMSDKLPARDLDGISEAALPAAFAVFRQWADALYGPNLEASPPYPFWADIGPDDLLHQRRLLHEMEIVLSYETLWGREKLIRELLEIMTTEAFLATAVLDSLHGIGWVHGRISDIAAQPGALDGWFLSVTGGQNSRTLMQARLAEWAASDGGVLGVTAEELAVLDPIEQTQFWALAAWRRETADPLALLETAAQRLIHPDAAVLWTRYAPAPSRPGTLLAQPGSTATLGGAAALLYPGVRVQLPVDGGSDDGERARAVLPLLLRVFLPVSLRVEVLWSQSAARLDQPAYLQHPFQSGASLSPSGAAVPEALPLSDPLTL
jgi:hypothetical protein